MTGKTIQAGTGSSRCPRNSNRFNHGLDRWPNCPPVREPNDRFNSCKQDSLSPMLNLHQNESRLYLANSLVYWTVAGCRPRKALRGLESNRAEGLLILGQILAQQIPQCLGLLRT